MAAAPDIISRKVRDPARLTLHVVFACVDTFRTLRHDILAGDDPTPYMDRDRRQVGRQENEHHESEHQVNEHQVNEHQERKQQESEHQGNEDRETESRGSELQTARDRLKPKDNSQKMAHYKTHTLRRHRRKEQRKNGAKRWKKTNQEFLSNRSGATRLNETVVSQLDTSCTTKKNPKKRSVKAPSIEHAHKPRYARSL